MNKSSDLILEQPYKSTSSFPGWMGRKFKDEAPIPRSKPVKEWDDIEDEEILYITKFEDIDEGDVLHCISGNEEYEVLGHPKAFFQIIRRR